MPIKSKLALFLSVILPATVIVTTIELFFIMGGEVKTSLFWFNLCYAVALEALFFVYLNMLRFASDRTGEAFHQMKGMWALYYMIAGMATLLVYSLLLAHFVPMRFYISAIIIYTLFWVIVAGITAKNDMMQKEQAVRIQHRSKMLDYYTDSMSQLEKRYTKISRKHDIPLATSGYNCELARLTLKIRSLLPRVFDLDITLDKLDQIIDSCTEMLDAVEAAPAADRQSISDKVKYFTDHSIDEIEIIKILTG